MESPEARARRYKKKPYVIKRLSSIDKWTAFPFPLLGNYVPEGWQPHATVRAVMCDMTGFDKTGPAMHPDRLRAWLKARFLAEPTAGYGIVDVGQFQLYLGSFQRKE